MQPRLTLSCGEYRRTRPLLDGRVTVSGYDIEVIPDPFPPAGGLGDYQYPRTLRMLDDKAFDICEMGMAPLVTARSQASFRSLPFRSFTTADSGIPTSSAGARRASSRREIWPGGGSACGAST